LRIDYPINKRSEALESQSLLLKILVPIIHSPDPTDHMAQATFGVISLHPGPAH
jgi:hypothetical protein